MHKKKKIKTVIIEKYKYNDNDNNHDENNHGIALYPDLMLKLMLFARNESTSDDQLLHVLTRMQLLMLDEDCLDLEDYDSIVTEPSVSNGVMISSNTLSKAAPAATS